MTILFAGSEDADFEGSNGNTSVTTTTTFFRSNYVRCALGLANADVGALLFYRLARLSAAVSSLWATGRWCYSSGLLNSTGGALLVFFDGNTPRLLLTTDGGTPSTGTKWRLQKMNAAGTLTTLATGTINIPTASSVLKKLDMQVDYAAAGSVNVYVDGVLGLTYSGDVTTDSATTLSAVGYGRVAGGNNSATIHYWSECIVADTDTRSMSLVALTPNGAGSDSAWTGAYTDINETAIDDAQALTSGTANQVSTFTVSAGSVLSSGSVPIAAVVVNAKAQKGATGPANLQLAVRASGSNYFGSSKALNSSYMPTWDQWVTNPASGAPWVNTDLTAAGFQIGVKSIT